MTRTRGPEPGPGRTARRARVVVAAVLVVVGGLLLTLGLVRTTATEPLAVPAPPPAPDAATGRPSPSRPGATASSTTAPRPTHSASSAAPDVRDRVSDLVLPESDPVAVSIPDLGVRSRLVDLGLDGRGELEVPSDPAEAGWFSRGAAPGALGPAVIAGHVTWDGAPAVFHRLGELRRGDTVSVARADGRTAVFTVTRLRQVAKSDFPTEAVYGSVDHAALRLVTCGGTYDAARHRYLDNVVVFARLSAVRGG